MGKDALRLLSVFFFFFLLNTSPWPPKWGAWAWGCQRGFALYLQRQKKRFVHTLPRVFCLTVPKVINTTTGRLEMIHFVFFFFFLMCHKNTWNSQVFYEPSTWRVISDSCMAHSNLSLIMNVCTKQGLVSHQSGSHCIALNCYTV